jgi:hypothetical protein
MVERSGMNPYGISGSKRNWNTIAQKLSTSLEKPVFALVSDFSVLRALNSLDGLWVTAGLEKSWYIPACS